MEYFHTARIKAARDCDCFIEQADIRHLSGSCTNTPAHLFWLKNNFCFQIYGQKIDNVNNPNEHGNYPHMIFYRVNKIENNPQQQQNIKIIRADKEKIDWIFNNHFLNDSLKYFHDKREDISGLTAVDKDDNILGFITSYAYELGSPLDGIQWLVPCIYVRPELRRQGIGGALINELKKAAKEANVTQLTCLNLKEDASEFWYKNNFDMCVMYISKTQDGKNPVSAALRIL
jgi:GNAT superfamily N-acetyltransferase